MIGKKILNYKIESLIGEGGMGNVYLASHANLDRKVAVKSILPQLVKNEEIKNRFLNEAKTMSKLQHPNIVGLYDYYSGEEGLFLFMEYVEGKELQDYLTDLGKPLDEDLATAFMKQILSAFSHAHKKGIVHRDIKPSNILISDEGEIKILDFGIAKILGDEGHNLTKTGAQVGTVYYMSPEQVEGKPVSHLSDIYSIGVTMYQLLTMVNPYKSCTTEFEIYKKITGEKLPNVQDLNPNLSSLVVSIIDKATAKSPEDRFQSCQEFSDAFDSKENVPPVAPTKEPTKKAITKEKSSGSNKGILIASIVIIALGVGVWFAFFNNSNQKNDEQTTENIELENQENELNVNMIGDWTGDFNGNNILLKINSQEGKELVGFSELKNNHVSFTGEVSQEDGSTILILNEPKNKNYNGSFNIRLSNDHLIGNWTSYNGRLKRDFNLIPLAEFNSIQSELYNKIKNYYSSLNSDAFNAWDHYSSRVDQFITRQNISPNEINSLNQNKTDFLESYAETIGDQLESFRLVGEDKICNVWINFTCWRTNRMQWQHCKIHVEFIFDKDNKIKSYKELDLNSLYFDNSRGVTSEGMSSYVDPNGKLIFRDDCYMIFTGAFANESDCINWVNTKKNEGYSNPGYLWIPDYPSLSGKRNYATFMGPYVSENECKSNLANYPSNSRFYYCKKVSMNSGSNDPELDEIRLN